MLHSEGSFLPLNLAAMTWLRSGASRHTNRWQEDPMPLRRSVETGNGIMKSSGSSATTTPGFCTPAISVMQHIGEGHTKTEPSLVIVPLLRSWKSTQLRSHKIKGFRGLGVQFRGLGFLGV